ncbi:MAG: hypothetical protein ACYC6C_04820 [Coriobacteriia bacterium]
MLMTIECHPSARRISGITAAAAALVALFAFLAVASTASAAGSSTGELAFYPCTDCHPVALGANGKPITPLPKDFKKHAIELEVHDILGADERACLACHDDPARNPGKLILPDGSLVDVTGEISRVCQRCHFEKYREWEVGIHGKGAPKCSSAGCHDPHTPSWIYMEALPPFQGTGVEIRAVGDREPFKPLAGPPVAPPVQTPLWLVIATALGGLTSAGIISYLTLGRPKQ